MKKVAVLIGTRPGIIKMAPLVHELKRRNAEHIVIHSGQHYSAQMDEKIVHDVGLEPPTYRILRPDDCVTHAAQTAYMLTNIEDALMEARPEVLLVCGDANTNLAGALAARKCHVEVGHVEAGLRSHDWRMPEEHNRRMIDHISEYLFAPTLDSKGNLEKESVQGDVFVTGNTIVDALANGRERSKASGFSAASYGVEEGKYLLVTCHREENVDVKEELAKIVDGLTRVAKSSGVPMLFPVHPRTKKQLLAFDLMETLSAVSGLTMREPVGYLDFVGLMAGARAVLTDSGGLQEESCILGVPCITLRATTERPETEKVGANVVVGTSPDAIVQGAEKMLEAPRDWPNPFGDGKTSQRVIDVALTGTCEQWSPTNGAKQ